MSFMVELKGFNLVQLQKTWVLCASRLSQSFQHGCWPDLGFLRWRLKLARSNQSWQTVDVSNHFNRSCTMCLFFHFPFRWQFTLGSSWTFASQQTSYWLWLPISPLPSHIFADTSVPLCSCPQIGWKSSGSIAQWERLSSKHISSVRSVQFSQCLSVSSASTALCQCAWRRQWLTSSRSSASISWPSTTHANIAVNTTATSAKPRYRSIHLDQC